jgi:hypothetical protein
MYFIIEIGPMLSKVAWLATCSGWGNKHILRLEFFVNPINKYLIDAVLNCLYGFITGIVVQ